MSGRKIKANTLSKSFAAELSRPALIWVQRQLQICLTF